MDSIYLSNSNAGTAHKYKLSMKLNNPMRFTNCRVCVSYLTIYYSWPNIKSSYGNNKCRYKRINDNKEFTITLPDGSYEVKDINNYIHLVMIENKDFEEDKDKNKIFPIDLYANRVYNRVTIVIKDNYILELPVDGLGKVLGFTVPKSASKHVYIGPKKQQNGDTIPQVELIESVLVHSNIVSNKYQMDDTLLYSFKPKGEFCELIEINPQLFKWRKVRSNTHINEIVVWFTDQNNIPLDLEDPKINIELLFEEFKE